MLVLGKVQCLDLGKIMAIPKYFKDGTGLRVKYDGLPALKEALQFLARDEVLVGFPEETTKRDDPESQGVTNASLGYIHDNGAPEARIPARPFMIPGITIVLPKVEETLKKSAQYALNGKREKVAEGFQRIGLMAVGSIQSTINAGVPPPLADATVRERARKGRKGAKTELIVRSLGYSPTLQLAKPLIDTAEMLKSINYVVRNRNKRRK